MSLLTEKEELFFEQNQGPGFLWRLEDEPSALFFGCPVELTWRLSQGVRRLGRLSIGFWPPREAKPEDKPGGWSSEKTKPCVVAASRGLAGG
jgi:hypothetical protein